SARTIIDSALAEGRDAAEIGRCGGSCADYADRYGAFTLLSEVPYWTSPSADDDSPCGVSYADVLRSTAAGNREVGELLTEILDDVRAGFRTESPLRAPSPASAPARSGCPQRTPYSAVDTASPGPPQSSGR